MFRLINDVFIELERMRMSYDCCGYVIMIVSELGFC